MPAHTLDPEALDRAFEVGARRARSGELPFVILGVANAAGTIRLEAVTAPGAERRIGTDAMCLLASITTLREQIDEMFEGAHGLAGPTSGPFTINIR